LTRRHVLPAEASILAEANASLVPLFSQNDIKGIANDARVKLGYCLEQALTPFENPSQLGNLRGGGSIAANHVPRSSWITRPKFDEDVHAPSMIAAGAVYQEAMAVLTRQHLATDRAPYFLNRPFNFFPSTAPKA
jgi:hypothetical protein